MKEPNVNLPLEELLKEDAGDMVPQTVEIELSQQLGAFRERLAHSTPKSSFLSSWLLDVAILMRRRAVFASVLGMIIIGLVVAVMEFGSRPALAFADVIKQIRIFRPYSFTMTVKTAGKPDYVSRTHYLSLTRRRQESPGGTIYVYDLGSKPPRCLTLRPDMKLAVEETFTAMPPTHDPDLLKILSEFQAGQEERLGEREVEGHKAYGFHVRQPENDWTVWADARTKLPVRVELGHPRLGNTLVMSDFKFDEHFDEALFSTKAPAGYTVQKIENNQINATEKAFLEGLRAVAQFLGGSFPVAFDTETLHDLRRPNQPDTEMKALATKTQHALRYLEMLKQFYKVRDLTYQGGGVKLGDSKTPIFWWLPLGTNQYRVIYGDLSVRDMAVSELPKTRRPEGTKAAASTEAFRPYSYTETVVRDNGTSSSARVTHLTLSRRREVKLGGAVMIVDMSQKDVRMLQLDPVKRQAILKTMPGRGPMRDPDIFAMIHSMQNGSEQDLGMSQMSGRQARGFHAAMPGNDFKVWVDAESGSPIRIELTHVGQGRKIIMSDFKSEDHLDEALFSTIPPPGYTLKK